MKTIYSCTAAMLTILAGAALFTPHLMKAGPGAATAPKSAVSPAATSGQKMHLAENYGKLPLSFEANQGQVDSRAKFFSRGRGYSLFLTGDEAVLNLGRTNQKSNVKSQMSKVKDENRPSSLLTRPLKVTRESRSAAKGEGPMTKDTVVQMKLVGANAGAEVTGADELPGKSNYFIGNDPKKWRTNVPNYEKVKYADVYPGVDLVYYGNQGGQLEYDFVVAPGADASIIKLDVGAGLARPSSAPNRGPAPNNPASAPVPTKRAGQAQPLRIAANGDLIVSTDGGEVRFHKPVIYQSKSAANHQSSIDNRQLLDGQYVLQASNQVGIKVASYDHTRPLFVDPVLSYSTYLGGSSGDSGNAIAVDSSGNAYVTGYTESTDFPTVLPALQGSYGGGNTDAFVAKLNADGSALVYSTYLGGSGGDYGYGIAVDSSGNAYVTGSTSSTDFPTVNAYQGTNHGGGDAFVAKLDAAGSALVYSTYLGGSSYDQGNGIAVDSSGDAYVTGETGSTDFPLVNPYQNACGRCSQGYFHAFVTKLNAAGSALDYSTYLGGSSFDSAAGIAVDSSGNAYVTGGTSSPDFPTLNALQPTFGGGLGDAFVTKFDAAGSALVYSTYLGGRQKDQGSGIAVDSSGNAYVTGETDSTNFPRVNQIPGACQGTCGTGGPFNAFVTKINAAGSALVYSTYLGGSSFDSGYGIAVDSSGNAYVTGGTQSTDFPTVNPLQANCDNCRLYNGDAFVAKLNATSTALVYSTYLGGSSDDFGSGIAVDPSGNAYLTGYTTSFNFPTINALQPIYGGGQSDAFVAKLSPAPFVYLSPATLTFGPQDVGTTSPLQTVTLINTGDATLLISGIAPSGDFGETNNCPIPPATLAPGGTCNIYVSFKPTAIGIRTGAITITGNAPDTPQNVALSGTGINPRVGLSPLSLSFGKQVINTASAVKKVTLKSTGTTNLIIASISIAGASAGDFSQTNICPLGPASLAPGVKCTINVAYTPSVLGAETASLTVTDNAANSAQAVSLTGTGVEPVVLTPASMTFNNVAEQTVSAVKVAKLTNNQTTTLTILGIAPTANFGASGCGGTLGPTSSCFIDVTFDPPGIGPFSGALTVTDNAANGPLTISLTGTSVPQITLNRTALVFGMFTVGITSPAKTVTVKNHLTTALTVNSITATGDFAETDGCQPSIPALGTCTINVTFSPTLTGTRTGTLTVNSAAVEGPQTVTLTGTGN